MDIYTRVAQSSIGYKLLSRINAPIPPRLKRFESGMAFFQGNLLAGAAPHSELLPALFHALSRQTEVTVYNVSDIAGAVQVRKASKRYKVSLIGCQSNQQDDLAFHAMVFDASGIQTVQQLQYLYDFFQPLIRKLSANARIIVLAKTPETCESPEQSSAQTALTGFIRSLAKEIGYKGATAQLIYLDQGAETRLLETPLKFFLSAKSAYISGQTLRISTASHTTASPWEKPLSNKWALVTGAARGIGAEIARTLAREGAQVICVDLPDTEEALNELAEEIQGEPLLLDVAHPRAAEQIADLLQEFSCELDILVHNAGITRDKTLAKMTKPLWNSTLSVNLEACENITRLLLEQNLIPSGGRIICIASVTGIAGNFGQTNYATSKAGLIGFVQAMSPLLQARNISINAIAPGFIETEMTQRMPFALREMGRRLNSLKQGGLPIDIAEAVALFAEPGSAGLQGNTLRVCGQNLLGA